MRQGDAHVHVTGYAGTPCNSWFMPFVAQKGFHITSCLLKLPNRQRQPQLLSGGLLPASSAIHNTLPAIGQLRDYAGMSCDQKTFKCQDRQRNL